VVSTGGKQFVIEGPGALSSSQAAGALITLLNSPTIDDVYFSTAFVLENPMLLPNDTDGGVFRVGDEVNLSGTTNLAAGDELIYTVEPLQLNETPEEGAAAPSAASGSTIVQQGTPRTWALTFPTEGWTPGYYLVTIENPDTGYVFQTGFLLAEEVTVEQTSVAAGSPTSPAPAQAVVALGVLLGARVPML
jgi:hypothetical protein